MLIEFQITNWRSFYESQVLSTVANKDKMLEESNCINSQISSCPKLLRSLVLYGSNASGKSNLILGLAFMKEMVAVSAVGIREGQALNVTPFRLDPATREQPTEFEIIFIENNIRYQYGFSLTSKRVIREWLLASTGRKAQRWFEREYNTKTDKYNWYLGSNLLGGHQRQLWKEATRANTLFLSTAVHWNSEQLRPVFNWFVNKLIIFSGNTVISPTFTIEKILKGIEKEKIIEFLQVADLGVTDVKVDHREAQKNDFKVEAGKIEYVGSQTVQEPVVTLSHRGKNNEEIGFDFLTEESHGTQRLFTYAAPILDALQQGLILVFDELDSGLHPKMMRFLISLMQNESLNKNNAQLIFSTHDTSLLDSHLFRRDQIWFVEKDKNQASKLYPLTDFSPRKDEALEKGYLMGRYGALPFFGELKF